MFILFSAKILRAARFELAISCIQSTRNSRFSYALLLLPAGFEPANFLVRTKMPIQLRFGSLLCQPLGYIYNIVVQLYFDT